MNLTAAGIEHLDSATQEGRSPFAAIELYQCIEIAKMPAARNGLWQYLRCPTMTNAASVMTRQLITVQATDTVRRAAQILEEHGIGAAPVCDSNGVLVGMISEGDLVPRGREQTLSRAWWLSLLARDLDIGPILQKIRSGHIRVADLMSKPIVTATEDVSIADLATLMLRHKVKRILIVRGDKPVGIVTRGDLINILARSPNGTDTVERRRPSLGADKPLPP